MSAILLVDDSRAVRDIVGDVLRDAGHEVSGVASGAEAIALLERNSFDLLILDYLLPDMKGDAIARVVKHRWSTLRIAFLSGYTEFLALTGKHGENTLIPKPISIEKLCMAVEQALVSRSNSRTLHRAVWGVFPELRRTQSRQARAAHFLSGG